MYICIINSCLSLCFERVKLIADLAKYIRASAKSPVFSEEKSGNILYTDAWHRLWISRAHEDSRRMAAGTQGYRRVRKFSLSAETVHHIWLPPSLSVISRVLPRLPSTKNGFLQRLSV